MPSGSEGAMRGKFRRGVPEFMISPKLMVGIFLLPFCAFPLRSADAEEIAKGLINEVSELQKEVSELQKQVQDLSSAITRLNNEKLSNGETLAIRSAWVPRFLDTDRNTGGVNGNRLQLYDGNGLPNQFWVLQRSQ
jgi:hypothetical protein